MFTKAGNKINHLKKSGDIIVSTTKDSTTTINKNTTAASTIKSLDLVQNIDRKQMMAQLLSTKKVISIKDVNSGNVYPFQVERSLSTMNIITPNYKVEE
jgi:hypothetical protein